MKNFIEERYNIYIDKIYNNSYFFYNDFKYVIVSSDEEIKEYINISNYLSEKTDTSTFILDKDGNYYNKYNNSYIYLLRVNSSNYEICFEDVLNSHFLNFKYFDILKYYKEYIDDLELILTDFNDEYIEVQNYIDFYIGCAENGIYLLHKYKNFFADNFKYLGSNIKYSNYNYEEFNNPFNYIVSSKYYNFVKYLKYCLYNGKLDYEKIDSVLNNISEFESIFIFSSLLFNDYYFELVNDIFDSKKEISELEKCNNMYKEYINLLKYFKKKFKNVKNIQLIEWI